MKGRLIELKETTFDYGWVYACAYQVGSGAGRERDGFWCVLRQQHESVVRVSAKVRVRTRRILRQKAKAALRKRYRAWRAQSFRGGSHG